MKKIFENTNRIWIDSVDPVAFVLFWGLTIGEGHASIVHRTFKSKTIQFFWGNIFPTVLMVRILHTC